MTEEYEIGSEYLPKDMAGRTASVLTGTSGANGFITVDLPSGRGSVQVKSMETKDENLFHQDNRRTPLRPFNKVIERCVVGLPTRKGRGGAKEVNWRKVWLDDWVFLLFVVRRLTYGDIFKFTFKCPHCSQETNWQEDLATTPILYPSKDMQDVYGSEKSMPEVMFDLPMSKKPVTYRFLTADDQAKLTDVLKGERENSKTEAVRYRCLGFDGKKAFHDSDFNKLHPVDFNFLLNDMRKKEIGVYAHTIAECSHCQASSQIKLPMDSADFLVSVPEVVFKEDGTLTTLWEFQAQMKSDEKKSSSPSSEKEQG